MKKYLVFLLCFLSNFLCIGCEKNATDFVTENLSEVVENYFYGEGSFNVSVSSGEREKEYIYNGRKTENVEFAIFSLYTKNNAEIIEVKIYIDDEMFNCKFELNRISCAYIFDLEKKVSNENEIFVEYDNEKIKVNCVSNNFTIDYAKALTIGTNYFENEIKNLVSQKQFNGECYLRVIESRYNDFQKVFWYFYVYAKNKTTYSCVIDCYSGEIIVKN